MSTTTPEECRDLAGAIQRGLAAGKYVEEELHGYIWSADPFPHWVRVDVSRPYRDGRKQRAWVTAIFCKPTGETSHSLFIKAHSLLTRLNDSDWFEAHPTVLDYRGEVTPSPHCKGAKSDG